jgi:hypothetical protein
MAIANPPLVALSQPSYAPARIIPTTQGIQPQGANMFRHALLRVRLIILIVNINIFSVILDCR